MSTESKKSLGDVSQTADPGQPLQSSAADGERISAHVPIAPPHDPLHTKGWVIHCEGDHTVGIPDGRYEIAGEMWFNDAEEKEEFRAEIEKAFTLVCDPVSYVKTVEEEAEMYAAEQAHYALMEAEWNELNKASQP